MADSDEVSLKDICDVGVLTEAWAQINRGLDREGLVLDVVLNVDYESELESNLWRLVRKLENHNYRSSPCKEIPSAKGMGLTRPTIILAGC